MWQFKLSSFAFSSTCLVSKRFCHFKFNKTKFKNQQTLLTRFEKDIQNVMTKIVNRDQKKIKTKRSKVAITQSTRLLMNEDAPDNCEINFSKGSPDQFVFRKEGMDRTFLTTKMKILNTNYSRAVAEIFIADHELSTKMEEYQFRITQVRVTLNMRHLHIFWVAEGEEIEAKVVAHFLDSNKGRIRSLMTESLHVNYLPWIVFVYDLQEATNHEINVRLAKCVKDFVVESDVKEITDNIASNDQKVQSNEENAFKLSDQISFEDPFEPVPADELPKRLAHCNFQDYYGQQKLRMPQEMALNAYNLDYEHLMNKILQNLQRCRAHSQVYDVAPNTVGAHLPPIEVNPNDYAAATQVNYNTDERIKSIKKFIDINKKRKDRMELNLRRAILQEEIDRFDSYEDLRERLEERMAHALKNEEGAEEETCTDFTPIN